jgi:hypothetical protein
MKSKAVLLFDQNKFSWIAIGPVLCVFLGTTWILQGRGTTPLQLAELDNLSEAYFTFPFHVQKSGPGKTMENDHHFKYSNFTLSNGLSTWVKFISSGLGAILLSHCGLLYTFGVKLAKLAILGLTISFSCVIFL